MSTRQHTSARFWLVAIVCLLLSRAWLAPEANAAPTNAPAPASLHSAALLAVEGTVEVAPARTPDWRVARTPIRLNPGDRVRTGERSRAAVRLSDMTVFRMGELSEIEVPPADPKQRDVSVIKGLFYFLLRDRPEEFRFKTPTVTAALRGTEFTLEVAPDGRTLLRLIDGAVALENDAGQIELARGQQAVVEPGQPPRQTALIQAQNVVQWCLYYPGVLDPDELGLDVDSQAVLAPSLTAYRAGVLPGAWMAYPTNRAPASAAERLFLAALQLTAGRATNHDARVSLEDAAHPTALALRFLTAAVRGETLADPLTATNASQWLGLSYYRQSRLDLAGALAAARQAVGLSPSFAFGWARVAELEFSFGRLPAAERALDRAVVLGPRNAQAMALRGFLLLARNRLRQAEAQFESAMELDPMLANPWLGRGLGRIRGGRESEGRGDLQTAALLEPNRALLRSYLGKAFAHEALFTHGAAPRRQLRALADAELDLAKRSDPLDPTPWLYSALLLHDGYRTADAIRDLETSQRLNDSRAVYRSRLMLDQDQAVRSANLAAVFEAAGMSDVSMRESARAVSLDYANYSAHLNLAASYDQLRDPTRFNLRFESEWFNEHLLASLLAPVGAGSLSQHLSQQEYSRLFAGKRFGLNSSTEYSSDGGVRQLASQYGTVGNTSYALDLDYDYDPGDRPNHDLSRLEWYSRIKQQVTPEDALLLLVKYQDYDASDNFQYYDPQSARPAFRFTETQAPLLLAGWHHEWSPGVHTLFLGGRLVNDQHLGDLAANQLIAVVNPPGMFDPTNVVPFDVTYHSDFETYTAELNQIVQRERHTDIVGARYQDGRFQAEATLDNPPPPLAPLFALPETSATDADFQRLTVYAYHHWEIVDGLLLVGGVAYDDVQYPANYRRPPLADGESHKERWSPKAGLIWDLTPAVRLRGIFSQAVGGVSYDQSVRLEPTQIAGFGQSFRSVISESLVGSVEAPDLQVAGGALDLKPWTNAWLSLQFQALRGEVAGGFGLFGYDAFGTPAATPAQTTAAFDYSEWQPRLVFNQILGREWFLEAQAQYTHSELERGLPTIPATSGFDRSPTTEADLYDLRLAVTWRHAAGLFARAEGWGFLQELDGSPLQPPGDSFAQFNLYAGYGFWNRRAELTLGILNLTDQDYRLSPLNYHVELPRERAFYARLRFNL